MVGDDWIELAVVTRVHGVKGQLKVKSFSDPANGFATYALTDPAGVPVKLRITGEAQGLFIVSIDGLSDRNEAESWRGRKLGVPRSALKQPETDDRFYVAELVGMEVLTDGAVVGTVTSVENFGAGDLLEITRTNGPSDYFTFTEANFPEVDRTTRRVTFTPPDILGSRDEEGDEVIDA